MTITLLVNGDKKQVEEKTSLKMLILSLGFQNKKIAVEVNEEIIPARLFSETFLRENDHIEIVHAIGGG